MSSTSGQDPDDQRQVEALLVRYATALDSRDWALLRTCFLPDAVAYYESIGESPGYDSIEETCRTALGPLAASQHQITNIRVDLGEDAGVADCYFQAMHVRTDPAGEDNYIIAGAYHDEVVKRDGTWLIAHRTLRITWTQGPVDVPA